MSISKILSNLYTYVHALTYWNWPDHLTINLEMTKYSYSLPCYLLVFAMKVLNLDSLPNESDKGYGLSGRH